jgi:hypothetical protein
MKLSRTIGVVQARLQMIFGSIDGFLRDGYWTIEGRRKQIIFGNQDSQKWSKTVGSELPAITMF